MASTTTDNHPLEGWATSHDDFKLIADTYIGDPESEVLDIVREGMRALYGTELIANALLRRRNAHMAMVEIHLEEADRAVQALNEMFLTR